MHYIKRDIFVFKDNLHSFKKEKSLKNAKKTQNMVNFFIANVQKKHENFFYFNDNSFSFFYVNQLHPCVQRCAWQNVQNVFLIEHAI